jgi:glycosyltransferase involved in cell wall biosynthesis
MTSALKQKMATKIDLPMVSVCTPTFNRRPFIPIMFECFRNQTYPKNKIEWIIVDDGTDKIRDLVETSKIPQIRYFEVDKKMTLGAKRNYMHSFAKGAIIVYMDDDDYYPPERISHAVEKLQENKNALCAGSSEIYIFFKHIQKMIQCGPYGPNHATAGTFAFRKELLNITKYEEHAAVAEERAFLKDYTIPFVQLDPLKSILVFSHEHNTFDKRKMLENPHPDFLKESSKTVDMFIRTKVENRVKTFFMTEIDGLLAKYDLGLPKMKPDVLIQIKEIEQKRELMIKEEMAKQQASGPIMLNRPGEQPVQLSNKDVVGIITQQQEQIAQMTQKNEALEKMLITIQKQLIEKTKELINIKKDLIKPVEITKLPVECAVSPPTPPEIIRAVNKSEPEITIDI